MIWTILIMSTFIDRTPVGDFHPVYAFDDRSACYEFAAGLVANYPVFMNEQGQLVEVAGICLSTTDPGDLPKNRGS